MSTFGVKVNIFSTGLSPTDSGQEFAFPAWEHPWYILCSSLLNVMSPLRKKKKKVSFIQNISQTQVLGEQICATDFSDHPQSQSCPSQTRFS